MAEDKSKDNKQLDNSESSRIVYHSYLNKYRHAISNEPVTFPKLNRFLSHEALEFSRITAEVVNQSSSSSTSISSSEETLDIQPAEVRLTLDDQPAVFPTKKLNPIKAWYRRTIPGSLTCHQIWLGIHILFTITLFVLYITNIMHISGGIISICELLFGVLVRNEIFIALLHRLVALIPFFKYEFNRMLHCIGGLHVSCGISAFLWLLVSMIFERHGLGVRITGGILLLFILLISLTAIPIVRRRFHNTFEHIHRYAGWTSLVILLLHVIFIQLDEFNYFSTKAMFNVPVLTTLMIIIIIFLPWVCIRKVSVQFDQPSKDLTVITFPRALYPYGSTTRISLDGHEWHAFAIALTNPCTDQHSVLVAAIGDWTKSLAENYRTNKLPKHIWTRQIKGLGFMYSIHAYRKVLLVCTGAGIAPALPYIKDPLPTTHTHLLWIAKQHEQNYGEYIWTLVQKTYPNFTLHDTVINGRPGPELIENLYWKTESQAIFVVSNEKFTNQVINALWQKDIPCFGALFDS